MTTLSELTIPRRKPLGNSCHLCKRSKQVAPGMKLVEDKLPGGKVRGILCERCLKGVTAFPEPALMFQAILYLREAL